jgi:hypothetical protein
MPAIVRFLAVLVAAMAAAISAASGGRRFQTGSGLISTTQGRAGRCRHAFHLFMQDAANAICDGRR